MFARFPAGHMRVANRTAPTLPHPASGGGKKLLAGRHALEGWGGGEEGGGLGAARGWKAKNKGAALADFAELESERASVPLGELAADEEAEAGAGLRAEPRIVEPAKALKNLVLLVARDPDAAVLDDQGWAAVVDDGKLDPRPSRAIGQGVVDQVVDDAGQLLPVGGNRNELIRVAVGYFRPKQAGTGLGASDRLASHLAEIERLGIGRPRPALDARRSQPGVHDAVQLGRLAHQHAQRLRAFRRRDAAALQPRESAPSSRHPTPKSLPAP